MTLSKIPFLVGYALKRNDFSSQTKNYVKMDKSMKEKLEKNKD